MSTMSAGYQTSHISLLLIISIVIGGALLLKLLQLFLKWMSSENLKFRMSQQHKEVQINF